MRGENIRFKSFFISLILLSIVVLSVSAASAATDDVAISEVDEEMAVDDVVSLESGTDDVLEEDGAPTVVTNDTFYNYFAYTGELLNNVTSDELVFDGDFTGVGVSDICIDKTIKLTGNNATFSGISFVIAADNVVFDGFNLADNNDISIFDADNVTVSNNILGYKALEDVNSFAIFADNANNLKLLDNLVLYAGTTNGSAINDAVRITKSKGLVVSGNILNTYIPAGGGSAIYLEGCDAPILADNIVTFEYRNIVGWGSTNVVNLGFGCDNALVNNNTISAFGATYVYGITVYGANFTIDDNHVGISSDSNYACGINPDAGASGNVSNNKIAVSAPVSAYGIYSGMWSASAPLVVDYVNNTIIGESFFACGIEIGGAKENVIGNYIDLDGNYTMGVALYKYAQDTISTVISDNVIIAEGTNVGDASTVWDSVGVETAGIKLTAGNVSVYKNNISSTAGGIYAVGDIISLVNNTIDVEANEMVDNYAITARDANWLFIFNNEISFDGKNDGNVSANAVDVSGVGDLTMYGNTLDVTIPAGGGSAIYLENTGTPVLNNNIVSFDYDGVVGWGSTNVVYLGFGCDNAFISGNTINALGAAYVYGITVYGANFTIDDNYVGIVSDSYYACGINPDAGASGNVSNNKISVTAPVSAYGIYSGMWSASAPLVVDYVNNTIVGDSFFACGIEIGGAKENVIGNYIDLDGNYTMGVALYKYAQDTISTVISDNVIIAEGTNVGDASTVWDSVGVETAGIKLTAGNVSVYKNNISSTAGGIYAVGGIISLVNNIIDVEANEMVDNYAITARDIDWLFIFNNEISFDGKNDGNVSANAVDVSGVGDLIMHGNTLDVTIPAGGGSAIYLENTGTPVLNNNIVSFDYEGVVGWGSTNVVYLGFGCDNAFISGNAVNALGSYYVYGITVYGANFTIDDNYVGVSSDSNYACGINPDAGASGNVSNNKIAVSAPVSAYGIYSGMWSASAPLVVDYVNNTIVGDSFFACGIEIGGAKENVIGNYIVLEGNYTMGVGLYKYAQDTIDTTISDNVISSMGTNVGDTSIVWDSIGVETTGIKIAAGNVTISDNEIITTGDYAIIIGAATGTVSNNTLVAKSTVGNAAVKVKSGVEISGTSPEYKTILVASDLTKAYGTTNQFVVKVLDENGNYLANKTIYLNVGGKDLNAVSDSKGVAKFNINLAVGKYDAEASFAGDSIYGPKMITNKIVVNKAPTKIVANKKTFNVKVKTKKYTITLKANNKALNKKVKVTLKVKGKTYTAYTNSKGQATFKITQLTKKGAYTASVKFAGNAYYKASSKSVKITVK